MSSTSIQTITGNYFDYSNITIESILFEDVALSLDNICRFNGHCTSFYSVAKHSCLVHDLMRYGKDELKMDLSEDDCFHGLIHDVGEAYLTDIPRPLKNYFQKMTEFGNFMNEYKKIETDIVNKFSLKCGYGMHDDQKEKTVKFFDNWALRLEQMHIMKKTPIKWDNEKIQFPKLPPFTINYFLGNNEINWGKEFLKKLKFYGVDCVE